jgi:Tol biopolymer transport system component/DNA-binding winged helix-turn-helix (wHTH) protein
VSSQDRAIIFRFGPFELDAAQQELRRRGVRLRLPASRLRLLLLFVNRHGHLITREEIANALWKDTQTVDIVSGINTAVNQLRGHLGDDPASPKYIETVIGAGYRFIASVVESPTGPETAPPETLQLLASEESSLPLDAEPLPVAGPPRPASHRIARSSRLWGIAGAATLIAVAIIAYLLARSSASRPSHPPQAPNMTRVTGDGDIRYADISPDGMYVAFVRATDGKQSLWLKQLATGRVLELADMGKYECEGLAFSPDGSYIYFVRKEPLQASGELYQAPFLGGNARQILKGISGPPAISPDGRRVAFVRSTLITHGEDSIVTASISGSGDGSGERVLATYKAPGVHMNRITWTADGKTLVYPTQSGLTAIAVEGGTAHVVQGDKWESIDDLRGLPPENDLIVVGRLSGALHTQIYEVPGNGGEYRAVTRDLSNYTAVRPTADGKSLLAVQDFVLAAIEILNPNRESDVRSLSAENQDRNGIEGLAWMPDGKIAYSSESDGRNELMENDTNGSNAQRLVVSGTNDEFSDLVVSPRGDFIAVARWQEDDVDNIWRMNLNGGDAKRLTSGSQDFPLSLTPDGQWIIYSSNQGNESVLMRVSAQGGPAVRLTDYSADDPSVSPDGKWIACSYIPHEDQRASLAIVPIAGGPPAKIFSLPETATPRHLVWTPDSRAVAFINHDKDADNILEQPLAGGTAIPVTHFALGKIFNFQGSRDGRLVFSRGTESVDAVLIRGFRDSER